jgi:hypothetical protein
MPDKALDPVEWELVRADIAMEKARLKANGDWSKWEEFQRGQLDMNVGIAGADNNVIVVVEQKITVQRVRPDFDREIETEQRGAMGDGRGRNAPRGRIQTDVVVQEINCAGHQRSQQEDPQQQVLDRDVDR